MMRYLAKIAFDGTSFYGWQTQPGGHTVQDVITQVLRQLFQNPTLEIVGCGRTDTGVHAKCYYFHFDHEHVIEDPEKCVFKLNQMVPNSIAFYKIIKVNERFHARFDAQRRTYQYHLHQKKDVFLDPFSWLFFRPLDFTQMNLAAKQLMKETNFAAFSKSGADTKTNECKVFEAHWKKMGGQWVFTISADRFLRNMVRAIVGTLIEVGLERISADDFKKIIESRSRQMAGPSVPAKGLFLTAVVYPE